MIKNTILFLLLLILKVSVACQCPITQLNEAETNKYDLIFKGKITQINKSNEAVFLVNELYKGNSFKNFIVVFDLKDECNIAMRVGDEWIIYSNYKQMDRAKLNFCSRSRKFIKNNKEDFFEVTTGISFDDELRYLQTKLGLHKLLKQNPNKVENRNLMPNKTQTIVYLLISIIVLVALMLLVKKCLK